MERESRPNYHLFKDVSDPETSGRNVYFVDSITPPGLKANHAYIRHNLAETLSIAKNEIGEVELGSMPFTERVRYLESIAKKEQYKRWEDTTGVKPEDTRFIFGTPIYNEQRMGASSMIMAHVAADIPVSAHVDHVYVTNHCTDGSEDLILKHISSFGEVKKGLPITDLGDFSFDPQIESTYSMTQVGNHRHIHIDTKTPSKANAWRILTEMGVYQDVPIVMSHDANVFVSPDGPMKLFKEAHKSFVLKEDNAVIVSAATPEYVDPKKLDPTLKDTNLSPRQILPFGLLVPEQHRVNGKFAAWDPQFYSDRNGRGIPPSKLDDVVMAKQAEKYGRTFRHVNEVLSHEWGVPTLEGRKKMLKRFTTGYLQITNGLGLREVSPEIKFFEDSNHREHILFENAKDKRLEEHLPLIISMWHQAVREGYEDFSKDPHNPAFEGIEGSK